MPHAGGAGGKRLGAVTASREIVDFFWLQPRAKWPGFVQAAAYGDDAAGGKREYLITACRFP